MPLKNNSLKNKIILHFIILGAWTVLLIIIAFMTSANWLSSLYESRIEEEKISFEYKLESKGTLSKAMASDYSVWDDTYEYLEGNYPEYAELNIVISALDSFESDEVWIYTKDFTLKTSVSRSNNNHDIADKKESILELFKNNHTVMFYYATNEGVLEVHGSTVVKSTDYEHEGESSGYFFVGRLINDDYLSRFQVATIDNVTYVKNTENDISQPFRNGHLFYSVDINEVDGADAGHILVKQNASYLKEFNDRKNIALWTLSIMVAIVIALSYVATWRWVLKPMDTIYEGLEKKITPDFEKLSREDSLFGKSAQLISKAKDDEKNSSQELDEKKKLLESLEASKTEIEQTNAVMVGRELKMIEMKNELVDLKKKYGVDDNKTKRPISLSPTKDEDGNDS